MPRRNPLFATDEVYHVFNRGVEKRDIFSNDLDYLRFLKALDHYRSGNRNRLSHLLRWKIKASDEKEYVKILCYCLMPNHFHLILKQVQEGGISNFIGKLLNSYTKYFNTKYERVGPLFQGPFKAIRMENDEQLVHTSRYIHLNPIVANLVDDIKDYPWSSIRSFIGNAENPLVSTAEVLSYFPTKNDYKQFVIDQINYAKDLDKIKHQLID